MQIALVAPTYQERDNIEAFLRAVRASLPEASILICDDNSPDGTAMLAEKVGADLGQIEVLHRPTKEGLGAAYRQGFRHANWPGQPGGCHWHKPRCVQGQGAPIH